MLLPISSTPSKFVFPLFTSEDIFLICHCKSIISSDFLQNMLEVLNVPVAFIYFAEYRSTDPDKQNFQVL